MINNNLTDVKVGDKLLRFAIGNAARHISTTQMGKEVIVSKVGRVWLEVEGETSKYSRENGYDKSNSISNYVVTKTRNEYLEMFEKDSLRAKVVRGLNNLSYVELEKIFDEYVSEKKSTTESDQTK